MRDGQHSGSTRSEAPAPPREAARSEPGLGAWLAFWVQIVVLAFLAILGTFFASANLEPGDYACGLILTIASVLLLFLCVRGYFDGNPLGFFNFLLAHDAANLVLAIVVFAALGLAGILIAASVGSGGLYVGGVALFAVSVLAILLSIKRVFDTLDRRH